MKEPRPEYTEECSRKDAAGDVQPSDKCPLGAPGGRRQALGGAAPRELYQKAILCSLVPQDRQARCL